MLVLCGEPYPVRYGFIEHVFAREFAALGLASSWVMPTQHADRLGVRRWHGHPLRLVPDRRRFAPDGAASLPRYARSIAAEAGVLSADRRPDAILVRNDPVMMAVGLRIARRHGVPLAIQVSHLIEETRIAYAIRGLYGSRLANFALGVGGRFVRNRLLARADLLFPISEGMMDVLAGYGMDREKMIALPEGVDTSTDPNEYDASARAIRRRFQLAEGPWLVYVGNMSRFRELEFLFRVLASARTRIGTLRLMMVGASTHAADMTWLRDAAARLGVDDAVLFTGQVPREDVPGYVRAADLGLSPFPPNDVLSTNSPIKLLEYLAMERPAVGTDIPEQRLVLRRSGGGYAVPHEVEAWVAAIVAHVRTSEAETLAMGRAGRAWLAAHRDYRVLAEGAAAAMHAVIDGRSPRAAVP